MGAGILPVRINPKTKEIEFLFGKEGPHERSAPGWSDFGGGTEERESFATTAAREAMEESTGFLGSKESLLRQLRHNPFFVDFATPKNTKHGVYRMYLVPLAVPDETIECFKRHQALVYQRLSSRVLVNARIFEKVDMKWCSFADITRWIHTHQFRFYFRPVAKELVKRKKEIQQWLLISHE